MEIMKMFWGTIFLAASFGFVKSQRIVCREASVGDVVFLVDASIKSQYTRNVRNFLYTVVNSFNVSRETIRVGLAQYSDVLRTEFFLSTYHRKGDVLRHIRNFQFNPGDPAGNKLGLALRFLLDRHFQKVAGSRAGQGVPQVAVVVSSSPAEDPVQEPAEAFRRAGILLYAIGVRDAALAELREIVSSPVEKFAFFVPNFFGLGSLTQKLRRELCDILAKAAQPVDHISPACREAVLADIVFLVDSSTSIGPQNFQKVKNFLHSVVLGLDISSDQVRVGLAQYNDNIYPAFQLNQYPLKSVVLEHIQNLPYRTGGTNTGNALEFIRTNYLTEAAGSRAKDRVPQIVILVTDGESNDEVQEAADRLKEDGVVVYVVGVNVQDVQELQKIASEPFEKFLFNTENFNILQDVSGGILQTLCSAVEGKIKEFTQAYADVVFLVDTSQNTSQASFQWMQNFISRIVGMLDVGRDKYQIGLAQYGDQGHTEFLLNTYQTQDEMMVHIHEHFVFRGGSRRTGKALRYLHQTFFQEAAGSRFLQGIPQYAVVITSGKSEDEVSDAAQTLREKGVKVMSVGVQDFDRRELEGMGTPSLVYEMQGQDGVRQIMQDVSVVIQETGHPKIRTEVEKEAVVACPTPIPADLVFLIEEFSRVKQSNFQQVVNFLKTTVSSLSTRPDVVRIGLVFYSEEPRIEFSLDTFQNPAEILDHLDKLTYQKRRGRTKTGAALDFLRNEVFIQEKGSRSKQGVQQIAVVITEGFSQDNVSRQASLLRRAGVTIYAVGTQLASESEDLEKIASYPPWKHVIPLESFLQLFVVESKIKNQLCPETVGKRTFVTEMGSTLQEGCVHIEKADIYFLIDGSGSITQDDFLEMKVFMNEVIKMFYIGPDRVQFGVVQYSDGIHSQFILSQYPSVARLKVAIDGIQQRGGGTMTGQALRHMAQVFADTARSNVPWYLVVITDGKSADPVAEAAETLRGDGVIIYAIGVRDANTIELKEIAKDKMFFVHEFDSLKVIQQEVVQDICSSETCKNRKADVIFLIDGSESISSKDFEKMKEFMKRMVNQSNIGADEIRIGLLQFSSTPQEEFRLNQYSSKVDIHKAISNVQQMNDGTYTGKALNFTLPFFDSSRGGRPSVYQYLIVITDGVARDNVAIPAKALRDKNIIIFAIGVGEAKNSQLLEITNDQDKVYYEENFESLQNLEKEILYKVCIPQGCNIDLSIGIDISTPTRQVQQKLQELLPELMQGLALLSNISCGISGQRSTMFRYLVPGSNGQVIFDSGFEEYSDEIIRKFLVHQAAKSNYMDVDFLKSLGDHAIRLSSAKVKVLLVFTDGLDDDLERLKETSELLRGKGFSGLLIIGLEGVHKLEELQELEFGRGFAYNQPLSITLQSLPNILLKQLDTVVERTCCNMYVKCFGEDGHRGDGGSPGKKGGKGSDGSPGHPGEQGEHGERGPQGFPGLQGEEGCPGVRGPKGPRGFSGEKGSAGEDGVDGLDGEQGNHGIPGSSGEKGHRGNRGLTGPPGHPGEHGEPGLRGDPGDPGIDSYLQGPDGEKGRRGHQGSSGFDGPQGETGNVGPQGSRGRQGLPGWKGVRGESGEQGYQGELGYPGPQGPRGRQGPPGTFGQKGLPGAQGNPGLPGPNGSTGKTGPRGMKGEHGDAGERGSQGQNGPRGQPGLFGPDGYGRPGRKGTKGERGFPGYPGTKGEDGDPGHQGEKGAKGIRGNRGNAGFPGFVGTPGDQGPPGPRGIKGPKGLVDMTPCEIVDFMRKNCPCSTGVSKCPVFPTEVVFALDMSSDVSQLDFERMRDILLSLLMKMEISESNCPTGARVAIISYNNKIDYLIRFSDYKGKLALLQAVRRLSLERSSGSRNLGDTMRFVARHVFKRARSGLLMRKVAVFFEAGWAHGAVSISTATLELSALDVVPVVITFTKEHNLPDALLTDGTNGVHLFVWETESQQDVEHMARCTLCYDKCRPAPECRLGTPGPLAVDVDVAFVVDSSHSVSEVVYRAALSLVDAMLNNIEVAAQPNTSLYGARAALLMHTTPGFWPGSGQPPVLEGFLLTTYGHRMQMQRHIREAVGRPLQGAPALGHALEWTLEKVLLAAPLPRRARILFAIVASETSSWDWEKLRTVSLEAKCKGITLFVLALGSVVGTHELAELAQVASAPSEQHLLRLEGISDPEVAYAQGFMRAFLNLLKSGTNQYPPPELTEECGGPNRGDTLLQPLTLIKRSPKRRRGIAGFADDLEAFEATDFLLESGTAMMTSVTQKEAPENYEKNGYAAEENEQEMLAKQKENGKEISLGTASGKNQTASCSLG
ncbi:collagen alpha-4(VI) chain isoform X4 [Rousettus aegyptiacus]|nr:collagen alpha-4(VI) chain isoform X4 [Rousettus aegyptiacus]XP_015995741.2 collagen alpha-4(VI) chain isoform X4 [Rousettus aegyptiacus]XP_015995743.2 collagen alpha-4(VI) chain isoform X4 [Rousettus aegyptiacus]